MFCTLTRPIIKIWKKSLLATFSLWRYRSNSSLLVAFLFFFQSGCVYPELYLLSIYAGQYNFYSCYKRDYSSRGHSKKHHWNCSRSWLSGFYFFERRLHVSKKTKMAEPNTAHKNKTKGLQAKNNRERLPANRTDQKTGQLKNIPIGSCPTTNFKHK